MQLVVTTTYGALSPLGGGPHCDFCCPWDCQGVPDGQIGIEGS